MNDFTIFEDLHTLAHLWARFLAGYGGGLPLDEFIAKCEPDRAYRLLLILRYVQSLEE